MGFNGLNITLAQKRSYQLVSNLPEILPGMTCGHPWRLAAYRSLIHNEHGRLLSVDPSPATAWRQPIPDWSSGPGNNISLKLFIEHADLKGNPCLARKATPGFAGLVLV